MANEYILSLDQGTTSSRAIIFDAEGRAVSSHRLAHRQILPFPGWVSHNAEEIYRNSLECTYKAVEAAGIMASQIAALGITNQRETTVAWDKTTGDPVCDAIAWQCNRTADICRQTTADGMEDTIREKTGLLVDPYFSATKIKWILDNVPRARQLADKGNLLVGTMDCLLLWKLSQGAVHKTDYSNASRTMLFNIYTMDWDDELLRYFGIPRHILPKPSLSSGVLGYTHSSLFGREIPVAGMAGDQQAALFGQTCFKEGDMKNTYGTGCFILKNIGETPVLSKHRLLTTIAWNIGGKVTYALEGSIFNAGAAIDWMINKAGLAANVGEIAEICANTPDTGGCYFVPAFSGLGAPHWDMNAKGILVGMTLSTGREEIVRALVEAIAFMSQDVIKAMDQETATPARRLRVDGGVSRSDFLMQFQADLLGITVERPAYTETTALGAAYLAGLAVGAYENLDTLAAAKEGDTLFTPTKDSALSGERYKIWLNAVEKAKSR